MASIDGHVLIKDYDTGQVLLDKHNAINFINISLAIASLLGGEDDEDTGTSFEISKMHFGNGGSAIDGTGNITYKTPNTDSEDGVLYSHTAIKSVADVDADNKIDVVKYSGEVYSDIVVTCTLDYDEPHSTQKVTLNQIHRPTDDGTSMNGAPMFDELGLVTTLTLLSTLNAIEKSANRKIRDLPLRIRAGS